MDLVETERPGFRNHHYKVLLNVQSAVNFTPFLFIQDFFIRIIYKKHYQCKRNQKQRISSTEVLLEMKIYIFEAGEGDTNEQEHV